jgi:hypothetical protein
MPRQAAADLEETVTSFEYGTDGSSVAVSRKLKYWVSKQESKRREFTSESFIFAAGQVTLCAYVQIVITRGKGACTRMGVHVESIKLAGSAAKEQAYILACNLTPVTLVETVVAAEQHSDGTIETTVLLVTVNDEYRMYEQSLHNWDPAFAQQYYSKGRVAAAEPTFNDGYDSDYDLTVPL